MCGAHQCVCDVFSRKFIFFDAFSEQFSLVFSLRCEFMNGKRGNGRSRKKRGEEARERCAVVLGGCLCARACAMCDVCVTVVCMMRVV